MLKLKCAEECGLSLFLLFSKQMKQMSLLIFSLASSCRFFPCLQVLAEREGKLSKLKDDLMLFQCFAAGFWFAIPSCLISQDSLIFFSPLSCLRGTICGSVQKNCVDRSLGYTSAFFFHRLKTTCMCSICGIGDIVLWDVKHCDISQLYCNFTLVLTHSTLYLLAWYSVGISETPSRAGWY